VLAYLVAGPPGPQVVLAQAEPAGATAASERARAEAHYVAGERHYENAEYQQAIDRFTQAYELSGAHDLLFNIAQAYRKLGPPGCARARDFYQRFLGRRPDTPDRTEIEERLREMTDCAAGRAATAASSATALGAESSVAAVVAAPPEPSPLALAPDHSSSPLSGSVLASGGAPTAQVAGVDQAASPRSRWPAIAGLGGGALTLGGGALYLAAWRKYERAKADCPCAPGTFDRWRRTSYASYALMAAGVVGVAVGLGGWLFGADSRATLALTPGGGYTVGAF
jgi:tetratricopeptide (TPR) repeat protein